MKEYIEEFLNRPKVKASLKRAGRTVCQTAVGLIGASLLITDVNWLQVISASALAGLMSLLTSASTELPEANESYKLGE